MATKPFLVMQMNIFSLSYETVEWFDCKTQRLEGWKIICILEDGFNCSPQNLLPFLCFSEALASTKQNKDMLIYCADV